MLVHQLYLAFRKYEEDWVIAKQNKIKQLAEINAKRILRGEEVIREEPDYPEKPYEKVMISMPVSLIDHHLENERDC